ncbi:MAG: TolC family protein [Limnochordia bacterium]|jgi:outer membrane protein TolC
MTEARLLALALCALLALSGAAAASPAAASTLTLAEALDRAVYHSDYQAWQANFASTADAVQSILDKHSLGLDLSGTLLSYTYDLDSATARISSGAGLSLSKSNLWGTTLQGRITPTWNISNRSTNTSWSLELTQTLWPSPKYGADQIALQTVHSKQAALLKQEEYVLANARMKIERLYRAAQIAEARAQLALERLAAAQQNLSVVEQKRAIGEASEVDLISGELNVLRAERDLETTQASAAAAKEDLLRAVELAGDYELVPLVLDDLPGDLPEINIDELLANVHGHPLVLQYEVELTRAGRELEAGQAAGRAQASFRLALEEKTPSGGQQGGTTFLAAVTIGYPLLDRNQRADTLASLADSLENAEEAYENAVENVVNLILETEAEVKRLERDKQIAWLSLRQAELEWEAARLQHGAGIIDDSALHSAELRLRQAQLDHYESAYNCAWAKLRLSLGLVGDLSGTGGPGR